MDEVLRRNAMPSKHERFRIAVLDDYQDVALSLATQNQGLLFHVDGDVS